MPSDPNSRYRKGAPLLTTAEFRKLNSAFDKFQKKKDAFDEATVNAKKTVQLTLAWVGVGEKLVSVAETLIAQRKAEASTAPEKKELDQLQRKLAKFAELAAILGVDLKALGK